MILFIPLLFLVSCEKEERGCAGPTYSYLDERLYPLLFEEGSYWIYKIDSTNNLDSVVLSEKVKTTFAHNTGHGCASIEEVYYLSYFGTLSGNYRDVYIGYVIARNDPYGGFLYLSSHYIGDESSNARIEDIYDTLVVENVAYYNVVKMNIQMATHLSSAMNLYYVDSIGIVKKEIKNDENIIETLNLVRCLPILQ